MNALNNLVKNKVYSLQYFMVSNMEVSNFNFKINISKQTSCKLIKGCKAKRNINRQYSYNTSRHTASPLV